MIQKTLLFTLMCLLLPAICFAVIPIPARIGGTVMVDGTPLTQATSGSCQFVVTFSNGTQISPVAQTSGLHASNWYLIDISLFDATDQAGGANPGEMLVIHVYEGGTERTVTSPTNGQFSCGARGSITQINISAQRQPPEADAGSDQTVDEGDAVTLNASDSSDPDGTVTTYLWSQTGGISVTLSDPTSVQPTFTAPQVGVGGELLSFIVTITDNDGLQDTDECEVVVNTISIVPTANAGVNQTANEGDSVTLNGSGSSDSDGTIVSYLWSQVSGGAVTLSDPASIEPTFTVPQVTGSQKLTFLLTVTDNEGLQDNDICEVTILDLDVPLIQPVADAGRNQTAGDGVLVTLDGSNSYDMDGTIVTYKWTQIKGDTVQISNLKISRPTFTSPIVGLNSIVLEFRLTVTDNDGLQRSDTCEVNITNKFPPVADAGADQEVAEGMAGTFDGSNSFDPDGTIVRYFWLQTAGTSVLLSDQTSVQPTFTAPDVQTSGALVFELTVTDDDGLKDTDTCIINIGNLVPPVSDAGVDQTIYEGDYATLDAFNSSDADGTIVAYQWNQTGGISVTLSDPTSVQPEFTAPDVQVNSAALTFELTVTDNDGFQNTDTCIVNVTNLLPPVADAGIDQAVDEGENVMLDGTASSDSDGTIQTYQWKQTSGTAVTLSDPASVQPVFTAPEVDANGAALTFQLTVTDNDGLQNTDTCIVNVTNLLPPVADAGEDQTVNEGVSVTLDGSNSSDSDGSIVTYLWTQTDGTSVTLSDPNSGQTTFLAPDVDKNGEEMVFELTVTDNDGLQNTDNVSISINNKSGGSSSTCFIMTLFE